MADKDNAVIKKRHKLFEPDFPLFVAGIEGIRHPGIENVEFFAKLDGEIRLPAFGPDSGQIYLGLPQTLNVFSVCSVDIPAVNDKHLLFHS